MSFTGMAFLRRNVAGSGNGRETVDGSGLLAAQKYRSGWLLEWNMRAWLFAQCVVYTLVKRANLGATLPEFR